MLECGYKRDIRTYGRNITVKRYMPHCCLEYFNIVCFYLYSAGSTLSLC